jgi:protoporphyrinogen oxidase
MKGKGKSGGPSGDMEVEYLVLGAGPTGLGAATRLHQQLGPEGSWLLIDQEPQAGGLACTDITKEGFLFDMGGHVIFSHFGYFDDLLDQAVGKGEEHWAVHERVSYVWIKGRWVPYPFQNNLYCLPLEDKISCINGVIEATQEAASGAPPPKTFDQWILRVMGKGIADLFMRPYNFKVWAYPTTEMQCDWLGERVATVNAKAVIENVLRDQPALGWGPNAVFRFPQEGGTGGIWLSVAKLLPQEKLQFGTTVERVDMSNKKVILKDGSAIKYGKLISTLPLDCMMQWAKLPGDENLKYSSTHIVGIGIRGINPHHLKCWLYYPEDNCPFYRCTIFSHYAAKNCPSEDVQLPTLRTFAEKEKTGPAEVGPYWSLMFEISESHHKPVNLETIVEETIQGALNVRLAEATDQIVSIYHRRLEKGYPTPHVDRDGVLKDALPALKKMDVWARGRFGSWKYEVGNQDHSCMLGVEAVDNMLYGTTEFLLDHCSKANGTKNMDLKYTYVPAA